MAGADDVMTWIQKVISIPSVKNAIKQPVRKFAEHLSTLQLRHDGKNVTCADTIKTCAPYAEDIAVRRAWSLLKSITTKLNEVSKLRGIFHLANSMANSVEGENDEARLLVSWGFGYLFNAIYFREILEKDVTMNFLLGSKSKGNIGWMYIIFLKFYIIKYLIATHGANLSKCDGGATDGTNGSRISQVFENPSVFREKFQAGGYTPVLLAEFDVDEDVGARGIAYHCDDEFSKFRASLDDNFGEAMANLLFGLMTKRFDTILLTVLNDCEEISGLTSHSGLEGILRPKTADGATELQKCFKVYLSAYAAKPIALEHQAYQPLADTKSDMAIATDAEQHQIEKQEMTKKIMGMRADKISFHAPESGNIDFAKGFQLTSICSNVKFMSSKRGPKDRCVFMVSADLFQPGLVKDLGPKDYLLTHTTCHSSGHPPGFKESLEWLLTVRGTQDLIIACSGRLRGSKRAIDETFSNILDSTNWEEIWISYEPYEKDDFRALPLSRTLRFSSNLQESMFIALPKVKRASLQAKEEGPDEDDRKDHDMSYHDIKMRSLREMPKLSTNSKSKILGAPVPEDYQEASDKVEEFRRNGGVPLAWHETKSVQFLVDFLSDLPDVKYVFDLTPGSGAAAIGAWQNNMQYVGICSNAPHKAWIENIMDNCMYAVVTKSEQDQDFIDKVLHFFGTQVDQGMRLLQDEGAEDAENKEDDAEERHDDPDDGVVEEI